MRELRFERPRKPTAGHVQAEFYHRCRLAGLLCYIEYTTPLHEGRRCRFDALIVRNGKPIAIIECKSRGEMAVASRPTKQLAKYREYGLPVFIAAAFEDVQPVIRKLQQLIEETP